MPSMPVLASSRVGTHLLLDSGLRREAVREGSHPKKKIRGRDFPKTMGWARACPTESRTSWMFEMAEHWISSIQDSRSRRVAPARPTRNHQAQRQRLPMAAKRSRASHKQPPRSAPPCGLWLLLHRYHHRLGRALARGLVGRRLDRYGILALSRASCIASLRI